MIFETLSPSSFTVKVTCFCTGIVLISTQNPPIYNPRYKGEQGNRDIISVSKQHIKTRPTPSHWYMFLLYKYPNLQNQNQKSKTSKKRNQVKSDMYELPYRFAFVSELPFRFAFVSEWSPNANWNSFFFIAWFVKHGWCSQDLPFGCLLHHFYFPGVFLPSSISIRVWVGGLLLTSNPYWSTDTAYIESGSYFHP